ncbi:hypothetical protein [Flavobacterium sp. 102]|uniref:hypothetical protein n=1 Tax=Flavobacterium sp. 102 TaxID=2135623 RepID=UPI000EB0972F|nr:hypothetical protein [Flavobacterium sp. 102]RKS03447.1 hypothetical protein C8C84_3206 [Flavobacterium sp. 102]
MHKNSLPNWINSDSDLQILLENIDAQTVNEYEKASIAFDKLTELYGLPKYPEDIQSRETYQVGDFHLYNSISMYEVLGKLKFVNKSTEELKSNVLLAAYLIKNSFEPNIDDELDTYLGDDELSGFGYKGKSVDVEMIPIRNGESWFDKGCVYFIKEE